jgi:hypothetical protein
MPAHRIAPHEPYAGRRMDGRVVNTFLDTEVVEVLRKYCPPGRRITGKFLGRLILEHDARQEERRKVLAEIARGTQHA